MSKTSDTVGPAGDPTVPGDATVPAVATVVRLRPIRTLTIARDLAFRQRALIVLAELGPAAFAVMAPEPPGEVAALAVRQRADVVVLDMTGSAPALPQVLAALSEHAPGVGVVAVSDRADRANHGLHVLAKWSWAAELTRAVQDANRRGNPLKEDSSNVRHQQS